MVADVGLVVVKFDGLSDEEIGGWHMSQPSLACDDDGVSTMDCWRVAKDILAS